jgi:hypothetical protein
MPTILLEVDAGIPREVLCVVVVVSPPASSRFTLKSFAIPSEKDNTNTRNNSEKYEPGFERVEAIWKVGRSKRVIEMSPADKFFYRGIPLAWLYVEYHIKF